MRERTHTVKFRMCILALLALVFCCRLIAAEETVRLEEAALSTSAKAYAYDIQSMAAEDESEEEGTALHDDLRKKVGQPTPGILLSMLMAGGLAKLLLRIKRRAERKVAMILARIMSAIKFDECRNAFKTYTTAENKYCLRRQMVRLRL